MRTISGSTSVTVTVSDGETSTTKTTPLGQTVYGGQLNVLTGELEVTWGNIASYAGETLTGEWVSSLDEYSALGTPTTGAQVVYELATPQTVQLTPQEVNSLLGQNNISADTGDIDIVYVKASAPIQPNPTGTPTATLKKLGIEGTVFEVEGAKIEYSTNEHVVGTWIDGRDVYEKTIYKDAISGKGNFLIANYPTKNDIDFFAVKDVSYIVNNNYISGIGINLETGANTQGVFLDNNNAPSGYPTNFTDIYVTIRYVKKAVS